MEETKRGKPRLQCYQIPRIFRICPNKPAVEVTRFTDIHPRTGEVELERPPESIRGKHWNDVVKFTAPGDFDE
ncbi:hypothetical protein CC1G_15705 [Coprinopsis cinerea okayama7|uniref:Uncharacterized protein n=1 Tax=Coprinopsis cinerea (strain Okayama-7 / 130 / ATCC MYA-4618 / FGSC 9003) TaxID=240176 RepID=D6RQG6_COPC7|nr:hypothetical protein CC1G_15705 [Coprinopsis cinerea okayama7\|eukprot:XP_002910276.1 hypothetical protein CC1G_15705 [Coprinopsis cinerea okayama7\